MARPKDTKKASEKEARIATNLLAYAQKDAEIRAYEDALESKRREAWPTMRALVQDLDTPTVRVGEEFHSFRADSSSPKIPHPTDPSKTRGYEGYTVTRSPATGIPSVPAQ